MSRVTADGWIFLDEPASAPVKTASVKESAPSVQPKDAVIPPFALPTNLLPDKLDPYMKRLADLVKRAEEEAKKRYPCEDYFDYNVRCLKPYLGNFAYFFHVLWWGITGGLILTT